VKESARGIGATAMPAEGGSGCNCSEALEEDEGANWVEWAARPIG
jgi:hypothetical protein